MRRKVVALTGKIGSGKSTVAAILREKGFAVTDCDKLAAEVATHADVLAEVAKLLGEESVADGVLNKRYIRSKIFADDNLYQQYSALFWNKIAKALRDAVDSLAGHVFVEIAVLTAFPFRWDEIWQVVCEEKASVARVVARDNVPSDNVLQILSRQASPVDADRTIVNNGTLEQLKQSVEQCLHSAGLGAAN